MVLIRSGSRGGGFDGRRRYTCKVVWCGGAVGVQR